MLLRSESGANVPTVDLIRQGSLPSSGALGQVPGSRSLLFLPFLAISSQTRFSQACEGLLALWGQADVAPALYLNGQAEPAASKEGYGESGCQELWV